MLSAKFKPEKIRSPIRGGSYLVVSIIKNTTNLPGSGGPTHCLDLDLNDKRPGIASDGNFSTYLIVRN